MEFNTGRWAARADEGTVLFLIGMRVNSWRSVRGWWPVATAMPRMVRELTSDRDLGLLDTRYLLDPPRGATLIQYWRSVEDLYRFAADPGHTHRPAWTALFRTVYRGGAVGVWHETYVIGSHENIYINMPAFGLGAAGQLGTTAEMGDRAAGRLRATERPGGATSPDTRRGAPVRS